MRKRYFAALLVLTVLLGLLGGCGQAEKAPETENGGPVPLTEEEIGQVNSAFADLITTEDGVETANPLLCLLSCYYAAPAEIDLSAFLAYCFVTEEVRAGQEPEPVGQAEFEALKRQTDWLRTTETPEEMLVPVHRYPRAEVDAFLERYTGAVTADLTASWTWGRLVYVPEYDAYYNFTSDFGPGWFECAEGVREGDTVRLTGKSRTLNDVPPMGDRGRGVEAVLTLEEQSDGSWRFVSFLPVEETGA